MFKAMASFQFQEHQNPHDLRSKKQYEAEHDVQRGRAALARLLIKIRRGEAGYDLVKKFLHENKGLPPETEV